MNEESKMNKNLTIGVLGGMGTYATIHLFAQYAEIFPAEKEFDRPRIIIDNRCTMPSRVLAFLYHEKEEQLIDEMTDSLLHLKGCGCNSIILACNTSHLFLPQIYNREPSLEKSIVHIIEICAEKLESDKVKEAFLLGSEGTIDSGIYQEFLNNRGVNCIVPDSDEYGKLRACIEAVKQNHYTEEVKRMFLDLVNRYPVCILGCTELPILYEKYREDITCSQVYNPLYLALLKLREAFLYG